MEPGPCNGQASFHPNISAIDSSNGGPLVCSIAPCGQEILIFRYGRRATGAVAQQQIAGSIMLRADEEALHRLVLVTNRL